MVTLGENSHCSSQNRPDSSPSSLGTILGVTWEWDTSRILMSPLDLPILKSFTVDGEKVLLVGGDPTPSKASWILEEFTSLH